MKTPAELMDAAPQRLAALLRRGISGQRRTAEEVAALEEKWAAEEAAAKREHTERQRATWLEHLGNCGAPPRVLEAYRKRYETPALLKAREFMSSGKQSLLLSGFTGTGKTVAACAVLGLARSPETRTGYAFREWDSNKGLFLDCRRLLRLTDELKFNGREHFTPEERELFKDACRVKVLVLDEVGGEPGEVLSPGHKRRLEELVDARDNPGKVTVYTTNLSLQREGEAPSPFGAYVGARCMSRIGRSFLAHDCGTRDLRQGGTP